MYRLRAKSKIAEQTEVEDEEAAWLEYPGSQIVENDLDDVAQIDQTQETVDSNIDTITLAKKYGWTQWVFVENTLAGVKVL